MRDICVLKAYTKPCGQYLLRVNADVYNRVEKLANEAGRTRSSIACELLAFALDRAEVRADILPCMEEDDRA